MQSKYSVLFFSKTRSVVYTLHGETIKQRVIHAILLAKIDSFVHKSSCQPFCFNKPMVFGYGRKLFD